MTELLDPTDLKRLTPLYSTHSDPLGAQVIFRFFNTRTNDAWFITEFDGRDIMYGLRFTHEGDTQLGWFSYSELNNHPWIFNDGEWYPRTLDEILKLTFDTAT